MQRELCARIAQALKTAPIHDHHGYDALAHLKLPGPDYLHVLRALHQVLRPKLYVEIGVRKGDSLLLAEPETHAIGIDLYPLTCPDRPNSVIAGCSSDAFFTHVPARERARGFDLAFIDGDHSYAQALRDFENLERLAKPSSIIAIHDVIPMDERTATPECTTNFWTGDVWRLMAAIVGGRPDLVAFTVACPPSGLGIVGRFTEPQAETIPAAIVELAERAPLVMDWDVLTGWLNIVPNEPAGILAALGRAP